ncbi:MAG TPA: site-specific integrase [Syntrophobacteraceae bacterium]|jgi:integrase|nr:site-specific integrase [Syntrophobacteraceae bacterium]
MAIQIYCVGCRSSCALNTVRCPKCEVKFNRNNRKYRVSVSNKGQRVNRIVNNLTLAQEIESTIGGDLVRGEFDITVHRVKKEVTLNHVWEKFLPWAQQHKKSWATDQFYYNKHLKPRFGSRALDAIAPLDIERMKVELKQSTTPQGKPYAAATIKHQLVLLNRLYNVALRWGLYEGKNPLYHVKKPKLNNQITEYLSQDEMRRLMETLDRWPCQATAALVRFAMFTGIRKSEVFKLDWSDVDFERETVTLRDPKGGKTDTIPVSQEAIAVLKGVTRVSNFVFPGPDGAQKRTFRDPWYRIREAAGLPKEIRFHGLRHNFASHLVSNGMDLLTVGKLLSHKDSSTTRRYAHLSDERVRQAAQLSGDLLSPKTKPDKVVKLVE